MPRGYGPMRFAQLVASDDLMTVRRAAAQRMPVACELANRRGAVLSRTDDGGMQNDRVLVRGRSNRRRESQEPTPNAIAPPNVFPEV